MCASGVESIGSWGDAATDCAITGVRGEGIGQHRYETIFVVGLYFISWRERNFPLEPDAISSVVVTRTGTGCASCE